MNDMNMNSETARAAAQAAAGAGAVGIVKIAALLGGGALGALVIAAVDPAEAEPDPKKRRRLIFSQVMVASVVAGVFGKLVTTWLGKPGGWIPIEPGNVEAWIELGMPVGLVLGALSWGLVGVLVKLRKVIAERAADAVANKVGLGD